MTKTVINVLKERGFISQLTDTDIESAAKKGPLVVYCGFDPTSPSLHLGHIVPIMALAHFQRNRCCPIFLLGGGTAQIGDPSGKQAERILLPKETIEKNALSIQNQLSNFLAFEGSYAAKVLNNATWIESLSLVSFLRDVGKTFSLSYMLAKESIKSRLNREQGISITEFLYGVLQAYDFLYLNKHHDCSVQIGGSDQWGNIVAGVDLIKKTAQRNVHGITFPLLTKTDGSKFGKTEDGAIWLDPELTSPYEMYQYWMNTDDQDVIRFLKLFTFLPMNTIEQLEKKTLNNPSQREAQKTLAFEFVTLVHGEKPAVASRNASRFLFGSENTLSEESLAYILRTITSKKISLNKLSEGLQLSEAFLLADLVSSKSESRKLIKQGGAYINNKQAKKDILLTKEHLIHSQALLLRSGKKRYAALFL